MKQLKLNFLGIILLSAISCTDDQPNEPKPEEDKTFEVPPFTFDDDFKNSKINYSYSENPETHDYSNNWDFDGDGKKDSIRFVGEGGAHQQYFLSLKLSSHPKPIEYEWIYNDMPVLSSFEFFPTGPAEEHEMHWFVVDDFNNDGIKDIFVNVNASGYHLPRKFEEYGLNEKEIVLTYDKKQKTFIPHNWREM